jgi:hypothetical protein
MPSWEQNLQPVFCLLPHYSHHYIHSVLRTQNSVVPGSVPGPAEFQQENDHISLWVGESYTEV